MKVNLFSIILIPLSLWLGFTGRIDWWIIGFVWLSHIDFYVKIK